MNIDDVKPGRLVRHKGGKLYKICPDYRDQTAPRWGWRLFADGRRAPNNETDTASVWCVQWQVNEKHPNGREYQASRELKLKDLKPE